MRAYGFIVGLALFSSAHVNSAQQAPDHRTTESGKTVTVYSITWPTPISNVVADVEVCAEESARQGTFAFPSRTESPGVRLRLTDGPAMR